MLPFLCISMISALYSFDIRRDIRHFVYILDRICHVFQSAYFINTVIMMAYQLAFPFLMSISALSTSFTRTSRKSSFVLQFLLFSFYPLSWYYPLSVQLFASYQLLAFLRIFTSLYKSALYFLMSSSILLLLVLHGSVYSILLILESAFFISLRFFSRSSVSSPLIEPYLFGHVAFHPVIPGTSVFFFQIVDVNFGG